MSSYNPNEESSYLMYLDANNLYGWAMSQPLPFKDFKWIPSSDIDCRSSGATGLEWLNKYNENSPQGIVLEVDLEYPQELHDLHNDYPCAAEKIKVTNDMLSSYCSNIKDQHKITSRQVSKLIPTLSDKKDYVLHYKNLQLYLSLGLKLKKIHRVFSPI